MLTAMNVKGPLKGRGHEHTARNLKPHIDYVHVDALHGPNFETIAPLFPVLSISTKSSTNAIPKASTSNNCLNAVAI